MIVSPQDGSRQTIEAVTTRLEEYEVPTADIDSTTLMQHRASSNDNTLNAEEKQESNGLVGLRSTKYGAQFLFHTWAIGTDKV